MKNHILKNMPKQLPGIIVFTLIAISGFAQGSYTSADVVGNWENASIWTKEFSWMAAPSTNSVGGSYTYNVNGYITRNGDLSVSGTGALEIYDTLVIAGNLNMTTSTGITVHPGGLLIVLGDFFSTGGGNKINVQGNGRVAIIGNYDQQQGSVTTGNAFYIYDTTPNFTSGGCNGGASVDGTNYGCSNGPLAALVDDQNDLETNDPNLAIFLGQLGVNCGFATILASEQTVCSGTTPAQLTGNSVTSATYQWQVSTTSATSGFANASGTSTTQNFTPAAPTQTTWYRRRTTKSSCSNNGPAIKVNVNPTGTWTGTSSAVWTTAGNWCGGVPTNATDVRIGVVTNGNYPTVSAAANARDIIIDLGATVTVSSNTLNIYGNFTNNGTFTVNGTVNLAGTAQQTLTLSSGSFSFNNLTVTNSSTAGVVFNNDVVVRSTLTLTQGKVDMTGKMLTIGTAANSRGTLTNPVGATSWIFNGTMERWFTTQNINNGDYQGYYPLGTSANFRPFWISNPGAAAVRPTNGGTFRVTHTGATNTTDVTSLNITDGGTIQKRQNSNWSVTAANSLAGGTYVLQGGGTGFGTINMLSHLRLMRSNNVTGTNGGASNNTTSPLVMRTAVTFANAQSSFYIGSIDGTLSPLPVKLVDFTATSTASGVALDWLTASEINFDYFQLERAGDNFEFAAIAKIEGQGGNGIASSYAYLDTNPLSGVNYYRLKSVDIDGTFEYSRVVVITSSGNAANGVSLYPNPVVNKSFTIKLDDNMTTPIELTVVNALGNAVYSTTIESNQTVVSLPENIDSGVYMVKLQSSLQQKTLRIIVK